MPKKKPQSVKPDASYERMCARMIELANRGPKETEIVKGIAKAGNVKDVTDYIEKFKKLLVKFNAKASPRRGTPEGE